MAKKSSVIDVQSSLIRISNTVEFLGIWKTIHNPDFKPVEFDRFKTEAGRSDKSKEIE
jgi:hypothetical protein